MLALDVSRSMCSTDIPPKRLKAAQAALLSFIDRQDNNTQAGIVAFAGFAAIVQPHTSDHKVLRTAVKNLTTARMTAVGSRILGVLNAITEVNKNIAPSESGSNPEIQSTPFPGGEFAPEIIGVLSDGASNWGPQPLEAAPFYHWHGTRPHDPDWDFPKYKKPPGFCSGHTTSHHPRGFILSLAPRRTLSTMAYLLFH